MRFLCKGTARYKDTNGKEVEAPNGVYMESDGSIHIDLNAGNAGQGTALFTLAHELTHFVKDQSKKQFKILNDLVAEAFDKTDISMHKRVLAKQKFLESKRGKSVSYAEAHEEVVADAMATMLSDGSFYDLIMEIKVKDKDLFATIKRFFKDMIAKFTKEYENLTPDQQDAQDIRQMKDMFDKIQKAFAEALVEASENFQATQAQKNTTEEGGEKMMVRSNVVDVNGKVYSKVVKPGLTVYDKVKHSKKSYVDYLRTKIFKRTFNLSSNDGSNMVIEFAKQNERVKKDGDKTHRRALGELEATEDRLKMIAIINIRDLLKNSEPLEPSSENSHQWLDAGGWRDRISYMEDHNDVYPVILHIPKTRDGRYLLYDVSVIKDEGSTVDIDATALASSSDGRASDTKEDGVRSAVKSIEPSGKKITQPDEKVKNETVEVKGQKLSERDYSYEALTSKPDMVVTTVDGNVPNNRADVVYQAKQNAASVGKIDPKTGNVSVYIKDMDMDVFLGRDGLRHSIDRRFNVNAPVVLKAGEILENSIRINELTPKKEKASESYVLIGAARNDNGEMFVVRSVVNRFTHNLTSMDVLYAINAKKEPAALLPLSTGKPALGTDSTISIAELLDYVNQYFPDVLPEDVLKHFGYDSRPRGELGEDALYQERDTESVSNRSLLANAFEGLSKSSVEYQMIQDYREQIKVLNLLDEQLSDLNAEIHDVRFTKGKYDAEKLRKLEEKAERIARDINKQDKVLIRMEASEPLRKIIAFERKKAAQKTKEHIAEIQQNKKLRAEQTELRHKIRRTVRDLDKLLNRGNKKRNVKEDMQGFVSKALELADYLFTDHISDDDLIRRGITVRMSPQEAALVKETEDILSQIYDNDDSLTDEEFTELDAKRKDNEAKLRDLLTSQRNERLSTPVYNLFNDLLTEYAAMFGFDKFKAAWDKVRQYKE